MQGTGWLKTQFSLLPLWEKVARSAGGGALYAFSSTSVVHSLRLR